MGRFTATFVAVIVNRHRYVLEFLSKEGRSLGQQPLAVDWEPAVECALFQAQRRSVQPDRDPGRLASIEPLPHSSAGAPYCSGFKVVLAGGGNGVPPAEFSLSYFQEAAQKGSALLVREGRLQAREPFLYWVAAYPESAALPEQSLFSAEQIVEPLPLREGRLEAWEDQSSGVGADQAGDMPAFLPRGVLEEVSALTEEAGALETGGLLIGHLFRDAERSDIGVVVSAQIPARHAEAERMRLTFTPDTWAAARSAIALRGGDEIMVGWWHSHPGSHWCSPQCPPESRKVCPWMVSFFSDEDSHFHHVIFPKAYSLALVMTVTDDGLKPAMFGWRSGRIQGRGFRVFNPGAVPANQDIRHETNHSH
jgi:proteasome lid subunit RPN8/RPN11